METQKVKNHTVIWLSAVCLLIFFMVVIGGITRLTHSGLSMVDWKPLMGTIPPLNENEWTSVFEAYQQFPEYKEINKGITLSEFKSIFFWEYLHRLLGRLIGIVFFLPFAYFLARKYYNKIWIKKLALGFFLGGLQGLMGWYMVMSGLVDKPSVSHYRLAAHLSLAFVIFCYLFWLILDIIRDNVENKPSNLYKTSLLVMGLAWVQIIYGAFTAGLKAGFGYNNFPRMDGSWLPQEALEYTPMVSNFFENNVMVQFMHRSIGWILLLAVLHFGSKLIRKANNEEEKRVGFLLIIAIVTQFLLGVFTLIMTVPVALATIHQAGAFILLACLVYAMHVLKKPRLQA